MVGVSLGMLFMVCPKICFSDTFITSTNFYKAYMDIDLVKVASETHIMSEEMLNALFDKSIPVDEKLAIINALSWNKNTSDNVGKYILKLELIHGKKWENIGKEYSKDELLCWGYLLLINDYSNPAKYLKFFEAGNLKLKDSFVSNLLINLTKAQIFHMQADDIFDARILHLKKEKEGQVYDLKQYMSDLSKVYKEIDNNQLPEFKPNECKAWHVMDDLFNDKSLRMDMRKDAVDLIKNYVAMYKQYCG